MFFFKTEPALLVLFKQERSYVQLHEWSMFKCVDYVCIPKCHLFVIEVSNIMVNWYISTFLENIIGTITTTKPYSM